MLHTLLLPFLLILSFLRGPSALQVIDRAQGSVVRISGLMDGWFGRTAYTCSGFVYAPHRVLTAAHCLGDQMRVDGDSRIVVVRADAYYDLAVLDVPTTKAALHLRDRPVVRFESVAGIGYGFGFTQLTVTRGPVALVDYTPDAVEMAPGVWVQVQYIGGMSGGPVIDADGAVIGIVQRSNAGVGYGVGVVVLRAFLLGL